MQRQQLGFKVGFMPGMAINLGTELQRFAGGVRPVSPGVNHWAAIAKPGNTLAIEQMRINPGHLRRGVGAQTQCAARQLINQFEGLQFQCFAGAGQQGLEVLQ